MRILNGIQIFYVFLTVCMPIHLWAQQVSLAWDDNSNNEDGFCVEYRINSGGTWASLDSVGPNVITYTSPPFNPPDTVYFRVYGYNAYGSSDYTNIVSITFGQSVPNAPFGLIANAFSPIQIDINWQYDNNPPVDGFLIERKTGLGSYIGIDTLGLVQTYSDLSLDPSTTYMYRVIAFNDEGNSAPSNEATATTLSTPDPPSIIEVLTLQNDQLLLTWLEIPQATGYHIYRSLEPFFAPDINNRVATNVGDADPGLTNVQWIDTDPVVGNPNQNYFYVVSGVNQNVEGQYSQRVGEFDYRLVTTSSTNFNEIALPLVVQGISNAQELMQAIPCCNSVARWNPGQQAYEQYIPGIPPTNFPVEMGYPYYVNVTQDTFFTLVGEIEIPTFTLITTTTTNFNEIVLPLDISGVTKASELMVDIPSCNSVAFWNSDMQGYEQYIPGIPPTDFDIKLGYPYYVNVTSDVDWPDRGVLRKTMISSEAIQQSGKSHAPHTVWGRIHIEDDINMDDMHFTAFIRSRPEDILTEKSSGCTLEEGYWMVQCHSFQSEWKAGETIKIVFVNENLEYQIEEETVLTYQPFDQTDDLIVKDNLQIPKYYKLGQNYPNPFNPQTTIPYQLPAENHVKITVYNTLGQEICKLIDGRMLQGYHMVVWNGRDTHNRIVSSNIYEVRMEVGSTVKSRKVLLLK